MDLKRVQGSGRKNQGYRGKCKRIAGVLTRIALLNYRSGKV